MNLDNRMGQIVCTVHVIFVVLAVLLVLGHLRLRQVLGTFAASYLGAWLLFPTSALPGVAPVFPTIP